MASILSDDNQKSEMEVSLENPKISDINNTLPSVDSWAKEATKKWVDKYKGREDLKLQDAAVPGQSEAPQPHWKETAVPAWVVS